ncbi:FAD-dependent monooxygenase [Maritimibacter sp. HL-12]|uniref:FAD-dependent monooxygenase n=1 Tax=Maritimibacter sp. HL-12 TaxID=1162418 RepID=UPI000A0F2412|nr:FAD-dependent monooxygenase [Maritimibacter sp. HL-12]SMH55939.1 salicylate hydroxylase [Maritimibacter sp. HL-12]
MLKGQEITVLGGGIGGLAAAAALAMRGAKVTVLEQAPAIREVGAGLQISPNGVAVLDAMGLGATARARSVASKAVVLKDGVSGRDVIRLDFEKLKPGREFLMFHRADLIDILAEAARAQGVTIETGAKVTRVDVGQNSTLVEIEGQPTREAHFVVGAEGLHSLMYRALNVPRDPVFTGQVAWRALVPAEGDEAAEATIWMGPGRHMVSYPLRGGQILNIVAVQERSGWVAEGWNHDDDPANLRKAFAMYAPEARALLERVETVNLWGLFRHPVAEQWHKGNSVILGDAAHPTLPFMAQGAVMALEDAWVLAECLSVSGIEEGPALYQARRRHRVINVVEAANRNASNYHYASPALKFVGHNALRLAGRFASARVLGRFDWVYEHDVTRA